MTTKGKVVSAVAAAIAVTAFLAFRPDRAFISRSVDEPAPSGAATVLRMGRFEPRAHEGHGEARVLELAGGRRVLRLSGFATLNGPDLQVYLLGSPAAAGRADLAAGGYLSLGALKGNRGDQNYEIPAGTDLGRYAAVAVWCRRFGVNFTTASLSAAPVSS